MNKAWARLGDAGTHGGAITTSALKTRAEGRLVARQGDTYNCPTHGPNLIVGGSSVYRVEGHPLARHGDHTACGATLIATTTRTFDPFT